MGKRKEDESGPSLPEKVHMWLSSGKILYTLLLSLGAIGAYGNSETVRQVIHGPPPTIEDIQPIEDGRLEQSIKDIIVKLKKHDRELMELRSRPGFDDSGIQQQIDEIKRLVQ